MKIKNRKNREKEYKQKYGQISNDKYERLIDELGDKFNEDLLLSAYKRIEERNENLKYYRIHFTFYEEPIQSHRPRSRFGGGMYVPNAKENFDTIKKFIKKLKKDISIVSTPMKIILTAYYPMPKNIKPIDILLYELEYDYAINKPDFDNVLKAYCDMIQKTIILDDDIVSECQFTKYYSLKPRVELDIIYPNGYVSEYSYKTITSRKTYKTLSKHIESELLVTPYTKKRRKKGG